MVTIVITEEQKRVILELASLVGGYEKEPLERGSQKAKRFTTALTEVLKEAGAPLNVYQVTEGMRKKGFKTDRQQVQTKLAYLLMRDMDPIKRAGYGVYQYVDE